MTTTEVTDPNEMRKLIRKLSIFGHMNPDEAPSLRIMSGCSPMVRNILMSAEQRGLSDEDTMTMIAYYAIKAYDDLFDRFLAQLNSNPKPPIFILDSQKSNTAEQKT